MTGISNASEVSRDVNYRSNPPYGDQHGDQHAQQAFTMEKQRRVQAEADYDEVRGHMLVGWHAGATCTCTCSGVSMGTVNVSLE